MLLLMIYIYIIYLQDCITGPSIHGCGVVARRSIIKSGVCSYMFNQMDNIAIKYHLRITLHHLDVIAGNFAEMGLDDEWSAQPVFTVKFKCITFLWYLANTTRRCDIISAIDGCHIRLQKPPARGMDYIN